MSLLKTLIAGQMFKPTGGVLCAVKGSALWIRAPNTIILVLIFAAIGTLPKFLIDLLEILANATSPRCKNFLHRYQRFQNHFTRKMTYHHCKIVEGLVPFHKEQAAMRQKVPWTRGWPMTEVFS
jgi:hypothetical protein